MVELEYDFSRPAWEDEVSHLKEGDTLSAVEFLALGEKLEEYDFEMLLEHLEQLRISLDISALPPVSFTGSSALRLKQEAELANSPDMAASLPEGDPLRLCLEELAQIPAAGDEELLAQQYLHGDESAAQRLTACAMGTVVEKAKALAGKGTLLMDLIQEGSLGLWQSILNYREGSFVALSRWYIDFYMHKALLLQAKSTGIGTRLMEDVRDYVDADQRLLTELGRNPTLEEIAESLHITPAYAQSVASAVESARALSRAKPVKPEEPEPEEEQAVEDTAYFQMRQRIGELLSGLSEQEVQLLTLRYGLEGAAPLDPEQVGNRLGMTPQQVITAEADALSKLRG